MNSVAGRHDARSLRSVGGDGYRRRARVPAQTLAGGADATRKPARRRVGLFGISARGPLTRPEGAACAFQRQRLYEGPITEVQGWTEICGSGIEWKRVFLSPRHPTKKLSTEGSVRSPRGRRVDLEIEAMARPRVHSRDDVASRGRPCQPTASLHLGNIVPRRQNRCYVRS